MENIVNLHVKGIKAGILNPKLASFDVASNAATLNQAFVSYMKEWNKFERKSYSMNVMV